MIDPSRRFKADTGAVNANRSDGSDDMLSKVSDALPSPAAGDMEALRAEITLLSGLLESLHYERKPESITLEDHSDIEAVQDVRIEIARMVRQIAKVKNEIATITQPADSEDILGSANTQLESIIASTETATNTIMSATDEIEELVKKARVLMPNDQEMGVVLEEISIKLITVIEACSFQDLTGQRIMKVVQTVRFIEQRLLSMIDIWGFDAFKDLPVQSPTGGDEDGVDPGEILEGPALEGEGLSQADIDALFD